MRALVVALAAATSLAIATPTSAQNVGLRSFPRVDLAGFSGDANALPTAVTNIEKTTGGRVIEIRYNNVSGVPGYDVVLAKGSDVTFLRFSRPETGAVQLTGKTVPDWMLNWTSKKNTSLGESAKVRLADAIRAAEADRQGAPAVAAGIARSAAEGDADVHAYNVLISSGGGGQRRVAVDTQTGQVIADPSALADW